MTRRHTGGRARCSPARLLALVCVCRLEAQGLARTESEVKAAYLYSFGRFEERQLAVILEHVRHADVLTVSDMTQFAERGGKIQFVTVANRVRFEINLSPARQVGLILSSELLRVANAVRGTAGD
jgi:YfiR/HmsC-like